jgi:hypothetical protein
MGISDFYAFDIEGWILACSVVYGVDGIAAEWHVRSYDLDGSGRFTLRGSERSRLAPDLLPESAK